MTWLALGFFGALAGWIGYRRVTKRRAVTPLWLLTNYRREWSAGIDQSVITWPIRRDNADPPAP
jgi:hypothetical protein